MLDKTSEDIVLEMDKKYAREWLSSQGWEEKYQTEAFVAALVGFARHTWATPDTKK